MSGGPHSNAGYSLIELLLVLVVAGVMLSLTIPITATTIDASRARHAAGFIAARFRLARQQAVSRSAAVGLVFDRVNGRWLVQVCADGNGNGVRRADIQAGSDRCIEGPHDIEVLFPGVRVAVDGGLRGPGGEPPAADPVRFGRSDIASFSPSGSCTAGSLFLRSSLDSQYVVRVAGVTGRTRILRYDPVTRLWDEL